MPEFGQLEHLDPRNIWNHEAADFTPWLAENLDALGEALGLDLELDSMEAPVGDFALDILARDLNRDRLVVIENQLTPTNHDHLGKLLTYASAYDAPAIVWVTPRFREEHRQALDWLNQHTDSDTDFFGVVVEVLKVDQSRPAFTFRLIAAPNEWRKRQIPRAGRAASPRGEAYREFFQGLLDRLRTEHRFTNARQAQPQNWYSFTSGFRGISYAASFAHGGKARAEIYIDLGEESENKQLFDSLEAEKAGLEREFGEPLSWERLDGKRASRVACYRPADILADRGKLSEIESWFVDHLLRFQRVFDPRLQELVE